MSILVFVVLIFRGDTYTVTMTFQAMHCDACKEDLKSALEAIKGVDSVTLGDKSAVVLVEEKARFDYGRFKSAAPRDMKLIAIVLKVRGVVSESGGKFKVTTRAAAQVLELANPDKKDTLAELKKAMGGDNKFSIEGVADASRVALTRFEKTSYKDE